MSLSADKKRRNDRIKLIAGSSALLIGAFLYYKYVHSGSLCCATKQKSSCGVTEQKSSCCGAGNPKKQDFNSHVQSRYSATAHNFESDTSTYVMSFHQEIYASSPSSDRRNSILKTMETEIVVMQRRNRYSERDAKPVIRTICEALSETSNIKIIDFGMSKVLQRLHALGNPYYIAPEVLKRSSTHAADMWSVGVKPGVQIKKGFNPIIKKGYGPCFPTNCRSLLMKTDVAKRLTAKEALQHSWLVDGEQQIIDEVDLDQDGTIDHDYKECLRALHPDFSKKKLPGHGIIGSADALDAHAVEDYVQMIEREQRECFAEDLNEIMKEGWMRKQGGLFKTWKRRYFVLRNGGAVSYYRDETKQDARGAFSCKEFDELCFMSWGKSNDKRYGIKVNTVKIVCQNNKEREEWMKCFQTVCESTTTDRSR